MSRPVRLHKQDNSYSCNNYSVNERIGEWMINHPTLTFLILFIILAILFGVLFNVIYGMCQIESGIPRNFMVNQL